MLKNNFILLCGLMLTWSSGVFAQKDANWNNPDRHFLVKNKWVETYDPVLDKKVAGNHSVADVRKHLIDNSAYIFQGKMKKFSPVESEDSTFFYADYLIEVEDVFKGKIRTKEITLKTRYFSKMNIGCAHCNDTNAFTHEEVSDSIVNNLEYYNDHYIFFANKDANGIFYLNIEKKGCYSYIQLSTSTESVYLFPAPSNRINTLSFINNHKIGRDMVLSNGTKDKVYLNLSKITKGSVSTKLLKKAKNTTSNLGYHKTSVGVSFEVVSTMAHINNGENIQVRFTGTDAFDFTKIEKFEFVNADNLGNRHNTQPPALF